MTLTFNVMMYADDVQKIKLDISFFLVLNESPGSSELIGVLHAMVKTQIPVTISQYIVQYHCTMHGFLWGGVWGG